MIQHAISVAGVHGCQMVPGWVLQCGSTSGQHFAPGRWAHFGPHRLWSSHVPATGSPAKAHFWKLGRIYQKISWSAVPFPQSVQLYSSIPLASVEARCFQTQTASVVSFLVGRVFFLMSTPFSAGRIFDWNWLAWSWHWLSATPARWPDMKVILAAKNFKG